MAHVLFILACLIWGCSFLLMKKAQLSYGSMDVAFYRVVAGAPALWLFWLVRRQPWPFASRDLLPLAGIAALGYALPFWVQPFVIRYTSSGFVGMLVSLVPLLTMAVSIPLLGVRPTRVQVLGVLGGLLFMATVLGDRIQMQAPAWVVVLGLATPVGYAIANTFIKRRFQHIPPTPLTAAAMSLAAVLLAPLALTTEPVQLNDHFAFATGALVVLGVICTGVATVLFYHLIRTHGPLYASMVTYVIPCVSLVIGWLDGETVTAIQAIGLAGVLAMVGLVQYPTRVPLAPPD